MRTWGWLGWISVVTIVGAACFVAGYFCVKQPIIITLPSGMKPKDFHGHISISAPSIVSQTGTVAAWVAFIFSGGTLWLALRERSSGLRNALSTRQIETYLDFSHAYSEYAKLIGPTIRNVFLRHLAQEEDNSSTLLDQLWERREDLVRTSNDMTILCNSLVARRAGIVVEHCTEFAREMNMANLGKETFTAGTAHVFQDHIGATYLAWVEAARTSSRLPELSEQIKSVVKAMPQSKVVE